MLLLLACTPGLAPIAAAPTDDGRYEVALPSETWPAGQATLPLAVRAADDPASGLEVWVRTWMPDMPHENDPIRTDEQDAGEYLADAWFSMPGLWIVAVDADGSEAELVVSVE